MQLRYITCSDPREHNPIKDIIIMEQNNKQPYKAPTTLVVEVKTERTILVASLDQYESIPW